MHAAAQLLKISDISRSPGLWSRQDVFQACGRGVRRQHEGPLCWTTRTTQSNSERRAPPGPAGAPGDGQAGKSPRQEHEHPSPRTPARAHVQSERGRQQWRNRAPRPVAVAGRSPLGEGRRSPTVPCKGPSPHVGGALGEEALQRLPPWLPCILGGVETPPTYGGS